MGRDGTLVFCSFLFHELRVPHFFRSDLKSEDFNQQSSGCNCAHFSVSFVKRLRVSEVKRGSVPGWLDGLVVFDQIPQRSHCRL